MRDAYLDNSAKQRNCCKAVPDAYIVKKQKSDKKRGGHVKNGRSEGSRKERWEKEREEKEKN